MLALLLAIVSQTDATFQHWHDGKAELAGYELTQPRYGELRKGNAVLIFVSEPFSNSARVKADPGRHPASDVFPVLKLNFVKDFQTGIYDYNLMTSVFATFVGRDGHRAGAPTKVVFSGQEWCGSVFEELLFHPKSIAQKRFSYFDGEGDAEASLPRPKDALAVDELPILVRQIPSAILERGQKKRFSILPSLERVRLLHKPLAYQKGTLERRSSSASVTVPAGTFSVEDWVLVLEGGDTYVYRVEVEFPHRLVEWRGPGGERGILRGVERMAYWELQANGKEALLPRLGL